ncbi:MAG: DUF3786 domain-containing protein, partial [Chloroflexi bacterium]
ILLLHYLLTADGTATADRWIAFRNLPGGLGYDAAFQARANLRLATWPRCRRSPAAPRPPASSQRRLCRKRAPGSGPPARPGPRKRPRRGSPGVPGRPPAGPLAPFPGPGRRSLPVF